MGTEMRNDSRVTRISQLIDELKIRQEEISQTCCIDDRLSLSDKQRIRLAKMREEHSVYESFFKQVEDVIKAPELDGTEETWFGIKVIRTYDDAFGNEIEVLQCGKCGRSSHIQSGGDIACCPCEFENEGKSDEN